MRTRKDIEEDVGDPEIGTMPLILEVLLDIRDSIPGDL